MKAITLWPEWAYAIWKLGKDGENRTWRLWDSLIGQPVAIHAGVKPVHAVPGSQRWAELCAFNDTLIAVGSSGTASFADPLRAHIVSIVVFGEPTQSSRSKWAANDGQWFWPVVKHNPLRKPVKCKGAQGMWDVPAAVVEVMRAQRVAS